MLSSLYSDRIGAQRTKIFFREADGQRPFEYPLYLGEVALPSEELTC